MDNKAIGYVSRLIVLSLLAIWFASVGWTITVIFLLGLLYLSL